MDDFREMVLGQVRRYPGMEMQDLVKLVYENEHGCGDEAETEAAFEERLRQELALPEVAAGAPQPPENIGGGVSRVYLGGYNRQLRTGTFARLCRRAMLRRGDRENFLEKLNTLYEMAREEALPFGARALEAYLQAYCEDGCPPLSHSGRYTELYRPHYRLMETGAALFLPVCAAIDRALEQKPHVLVGIDGMSGSGKSMLSQLLVDVYRCGVVHTDDFFLRPEQKSRERLEQPGGNIDYERLAPVAAKAADDRSFHYQAYDCASEKMGIWWQVPEGPLTILDGVYAMHPGVGARCDLKIFLTVEAPVQAQRIARRNGPAQGRRFEREWIPMENTYFAAFSVREGSDLVVDTTHL